MFIVIYLYKLTFIFKHCYFVRQYFKCMCQATHHCHTFQLEARVCLVLPQMPTQQARVLQVRPGSFRSGVAFCDAYNWKVAHVVPFWGQKKLLRLSARALEINVSLHLINTLSSPSNEDVCPHKHFLQPIE